MGRQKVRPIYKTVNEAIGFSLEDEDASDISLEDLMKVVIA